MLNFAPGGGATAETLQAAPRRLEPARRHLSGRGRPAQKATTQGFSTATGLVGYLLEAPAKLLFPVLSPLRNRFARHPAPIGASAVNWKAITAINATGVKAGVAEGVRNAVVSTTEVDKSQTFKDFGLDDLGDLPGPLTPVAASRTPARSRRPTSCRRS